MNANEKKTQAVVIGGGPGGYVAAIRLGQLGKKVTLVEKDTLGGVCLNWGCIPSKALIHAAKTYEMLRKDTETMGIGVGDVSLNLSKTQTWKRGVVKKLTDGIAQLLKAARVDVVTGEAVFQTPTSLSIRSGKSTEQILHFEHAVVATGSRPIEIPGFGFSPPNIVDSKDALDWTTPPNRMVVIGGGVIGLEIGMLYQKMGSQVTVVEMMDQLLPGVDREIAASIARIAKKRGIAVHLESKALQWKKNKNGLTVDIETPKRKQSLEADVVLLSVGRISNGRGLGLEKIGVRVTDKGVIDVKSNRQTNVPHIYAIGDVTGPPLLAHKASKEGIVAAEAIAGHKSAYDIRAMPGAIFTDPEIATVGLTEEEAKAKGLEVFSGKFMYAASGRALSTLHTDGFVKVVGEQKTNVLLGVHILGAQASDLISEASLALEMGAHVEDLALTVHPHPTLSETMMEAAEAALGKAIHMVNRPPARETKSRELV